MSAPSSRQIKHASTPPLSFYRPDALPAAPTNSVKALNAPALSVKQQQQQLSVK